MGTSEERENELEKLRRDNALQQEIIARQEQQIELLRQKVDLLIRKIYGRSSEQLDLNQLLLFEEEEALGATERLELTDGPDELEEDESSPKPSKPRKKRTSRQATLPADLPVEETTILPEEVEAHPENYRQVGEEVTTKLDFQPGQFKKLITRRPQFVKRLKSLDDPEADNFFIAPLPPSLKERSLITPRLAAEPSGAR